MRRGDKMPRECSRKPVKMMMQSVLLKVKREHEREREYYLMLENMDTTFQV